MASKRSEAEPRRLIEQAVRDCLDPEPGLQFFATAVTAVGRPPEKLLVHGVLHFAKGRYCCGEPCCHLWPFDERLEALGEWMRKRMRLRQRVAVTFVEIAAHYHDGVVFTACPGP